MPARLRPVASEILRRIMELSCVAGGEILKFNLSAGGTGLRRTYCATAPLKFKSLLKIFLNIIAA